MLPSAVNANHGTYSLFSTVQPVLCFTTSYSTVIQPCHAHGLWIRALDARLFTGAMVILPYFKARS